MGGEISNRPVLALARSFQEHVAYVDWLLVTRIGSEPITY
jgi:hypothetical protein